MSRTLRLFYPFLSLIAAVFLAFVVSMGLIVALLNPPLQDIYLLFVFMTVTGLATVGAVYLLYRRGALNRFSSLRWTLLATIVLTVLVIFVNVVVTAQLMFISDHDLILTTALLLFASMIATASVFFISTALTDRIGALSRAAEQLAGGDWQTRLAVPGSDEIAQLAETFNSMAASLQAARDYERRLEQQRRELFRWVSHDLRTPLANMRVMNEALIDGVVSDPATVSRYLTNTQTEIQHLSRLIDDLFELAKLDGQQIELDFADASLLDLLSDTLESMQARAAQQAVRLSGSIEEGVNLLYMAADKIQRVIYNLLDNALHHTPPGGAVLLTARRSGEWAEIRVHNSGSYIPPEEIDRVFTSFYRGEASRRQRSGGSRGTGLGLAIARGFVEAHGGFIHAESDPERGTTFVVRLPTARRRA